MESRVTVLDLLIDPFSGGFHQDNMRNRIHGQIFNQFAVVDSAVHASDQDRSWGRDTLQCLDRCVADGGDGVIIVTDAI